MYLRNKAGEGVRAEHLSAFFLLFSIVCIPLFYIVSSKYSHISCFFRWIHAHAYFSRIRFSLLPVILKVNFVAVIIELQQVSLMLSMRILWSLNFLIDLFGLLLPVFLNSIQTYITWMASFPVNIKSCQNKAAMTMAATRSSEPSLRHNYPFSVRCCLLSLNCISSETNIRKITCLPLRGQSEGHFERHLTKSVWTEKKWTNITNH